ncbi:DUF5344 family protein [Virgibacillus sp. 179-BFC.A HS]|uniref:DUF5344 family protein n=1 Tax=Tigheibacillus jepli TaxID=3035914 RepID=A0ABU5CEB7_9BACI|nr:DUF5344 family protein [Virgibacillus sp. 179-BFC.A HS]MDY0404688.1 DUF5344 family protein [Virgibacillus sp. 179-BFC.A HS]
MAEISLMSTGGGSYEIEIDYPVVEKELDNAKQFLRSVKLPNVYEGINGQNKLQFVSDWLKRENEIYTLLEQYIEIVEQNIEDTKISAELLKKQDEELAKRK